MDEYELLEKSLCDEEIQKLEAQNLRLVSQHKAACLEKEASKYWDLFYKRNETRFFKDRHWTTREFQELLDNKSSVREQRIIFEVGCGVGNFIFPLIEESLNFYVLACDFSPRAVQYVKNNCLYDENKMSVFQADITTNRVFEFVTENSVDIVTLIFVLSAVHPDKFVYVLKNLYKVLKPGGFILFRDYGLYDMAQLRFKAGCKISENLYMRQDGTRFVFAIIYSLLILSICFSFKELLFLLKLC